MTPEAFLHDIVEHPEDDAPRLVFADWLDDHGDAARAEFIRVQCELAEGVVVEQRRADLLARERQLLEVNEARWRAGLPTFPGVSWLRWSRGFVTGVKINSAKAFREHADALFTAAPVQELELGAQVSARTLRDVLASPLLARLTSLTQFQAAWGDAAAQAVAACPGLSGLRALHLLSCGFGPAGAAALAGSAYLNRLRELFLDRNPVGDEGVIALAKSPLLRPVERLHLYEAGLGDRAAEALARSHHTQGIRELWLGRNSLGDAGVQELSRGSALSSLRVLNLTHNRITDEGAATLASMRGLPALVELHLGGNRISTAGALALAAGAALERLKRLTFYNYTNQIDAAGVAALRERLGDRVEVK